MRAGEGTQGNVLEGDSLGWLASRKETGDQGRPSGTPRERLGEARTWTTPWCSHPSSSREPLLSLRAGIPAQDPNPPRNAPRNQKSFSLLLSKTMQTSFMSYVRGLKHCLIYCECQIFFLCKYFRQSRNSKPLLRLPNVSHDKSLFSDVQICVRKPNKGKMFRLCLNPKACIVREKKSF